MKFCNDCEDRVHNLVGDRFKKYNYLADIALLLNLALLIILYRYIDAKLFKSLMTVYVALYIFRYLLAFITKCEAPVNQKDRPWLSPDTYWYIISGHLMFSMIVTYLIWFNGAPRWTFYLSLILTVTLAILLTITKEHYTKDILLTIVFVGLILKVFGSKNK